MLDYLNCKNKIKGAWPVLKMEIVEITGIEFKVIATWRRFYVYTTEVREVISVQPLKQCTCSAAHIEYGTRPIRETCCNNVDNVIMKPR